MKLNWFSPLLPASTDIAHYTKRVLPALSARAQVVLWTDSEDWVRSIEEFARVRRYKPERVDWSELNRADMNIYQIGNNPLFHGSIWQVAQKSPGIVVLHDFRLHHFFDGLYRVRWRDLHAYLREMQFYYGEAGRRDALECFRSEARNIDEMAERYPLTQLALRGALGCVVHTRAAFEELKDESECPMVYAPLPFESESGRNGARASVDAEKRAEGPPFRLIIFGYLGRNRRLDVVLTALAEFPEKEKFHLEIYGQLLDNKSLRGPIRALGLKRLVSVRGFVPEEGLDDALSRSALAINLRYPTMGEASGSQLRIWSHALPSLVSEVGWYATLPADAVAFVRPEHEVEDIQKCLREFLDDPQRFARMGLRGRQVLEEEHTPENYAQTLMSFVHKAQSFRTRSAANKLALRAGSLLGAWHTPKPDDATLRRVATEIFKMMNDE